MARDLSGCLLVASPAIADPHFTRTVVLVLRHDLEGALGVVLNRPTETEVRTLTPALEVLVEHGDVVHEGGPVQTEAALAVAEFVDPAEAAVPVSGRIGIVAVPPEPVPGVLRARVFAGYAGWSGGQLEREIDIDDWWLASARPDDVFHPTPERLWSELLRRRGGGYAMLADPPADPSLN